MIKSILAAGAVLLLALAASAQPEPSPIEAYVEEGLSNNLALQQQTVSVEQARLRLREARSLFGPTLSLEARYTVAGGGRTIDFPVGDLLNPVYATLNQLTGSQSFPTIDNEEIGFLLPREQDTRLRLLQPIYQPVIGYNARLQQNQLDAEQAGVDAYRDELALEIRSAYYGYLQAQQIANLLDSTRVLVEENVRVSRRLVANDQATEDVVFRAQAELLGLDRQRAEASQGRLAARNYFNFLLNRSLESEIEPEREAVEFTDAGSFTDAPAISDALDLRDELRQLDFGLRAADQGVKIARANYLPSLALALDAGIQGETYTFNDGAPFYAGSVVLSWTLFDLGTRRARTEQARLQRQQLDVRRDELRRQIELQVRDAFNAVDVAQREVEAAEGALQAAQKSFDIVSRKFALGLSPQLEFLDARTTLTDAGIDALVARYGLKIRVAEYRRAIGA
ncbi:MAG: TolC family protein [Bacteroidota bacterium]